MAKQEGVGKAMLEVVGKVGGYDALMKASEYAVDTALEEGILKELPIVKIVVGVVRGGLGIKELLFVRKLRGFMEALSDVSESARTTFAVEMGKDPDLTEKVGSHLVLLLDRMDEMTKPRLLGRAFATLMMTTITFDEFRRMGRVLDRCFLDDLFLWVREPDRARRSGAGAVDMIACGVLEEVDIVNSPLSGPVRPNYRWTDFGQKLARIVLVPEVQAGSRK